MKIWASAVFSVLLTGCAYNWHPVVPDGLRTIVVPTFENRSEVTELGAVATRQILREIQREGTFAVGSGDRSALELQGVIESSRSKAQGDRRLVGSRGVSADLEVVARVSLIDKARGAILFDNRTYRAVAQYTSGDDVMTGERNASGRAAEDLARQIVDDIVMFNYSKGGAK